MARITPRKREPNGQPSRAEARALDRLLDAQSPAAATRLRDLALREIAAPEYGSEIGRLFITNKISAAQYEAGKRWAILVQCYYRALGTRPDPPSSAWLGRIRSYAHLAAPESESGLKRVVVKTYDDALAALRDYAPNSERIVRACCERDAPLTTAEQLEKLRRGLNAFAAFFRVAGPS
jgi:hypothetical protein